MKRRKRTETTAGAIFCEEFRRLLKTKDVTQTRAAKIMEVSPSFVNAVCSGKKLPTAQHVRLLHEAIGLSEEERTNMNLLGARACGWEL